jgi:prevent-host-death family protein
MRKTMSAAEVKSRFAESLRLVEAGEAVVITRHGKAVAALVRAEELDQLERLRAARPEDGLAKVLGRWKDGGEFAAEIERVVEGRTPPRAVQDLE